MILNVRIQFFSFIVALGVLEGCARQVSIPRYDVTDLANGHHYIAEGREINKTAGGVTFMDEKGQYVTLQSYTDTRIEDAQYTVEYNAITGTWTRTARLK